MITKTSAEAQNNFGQLLDTAQREPVAITRHGRPTAYVISPEHMEDLQTILERRRRAGRDLEEWRVKARESMTPEAAALTAEDINRLVHEIRDDIDREEKEKLVHNRKSRKS